MEELDESYPESITVEELRKRKISLDTILEAIDGGLITYPSIYKGLYTRRIFEKDNINGQMPCNLSSRGFELLNQVRMKEAIDQLDESINNFNESSSRAYNQLNDSIRKFNESSDKSSKAIELYNARLVNLTFLLVILTVALLIIPPDTPSSEKYLGVIFIFVTVIMLLPIKKN